MMGLEDVADDFSYKTGARFASGISFMPEWNALHTELTSYR
jgi:hypothetical protein